MDRLQQSLLEREGIHPSLSNYKRRTKPLTQEEIEKRNFFESLDFVHVENDGYSKMIGLRKHKDVVMANLARWCLIILIGLLTGCIFYAVHRAIDEIFQWKLNVSLNFIENGELGAGFLSLLTFNICLGLLASLVVVFWEPGVQGSGIPEVKAYLNGARVPKGMNVRVLAGKVIAVIFSVSSSLAIGPEGPMIHSGAMIGGGVGTLSSKSLGCEPRCSRSINNPRDRRDFISSGAAAGVSAAFGAPIGGILFAIEQASSFWSPRLTWRTFFCCMVSTFTVNFFLSGMNGDFDKRSTIVFQLGSTGGGYNIGELIPFALIGLCGGLMGALFVFLNSKLLAFRLKYVTPWKSVKVLEVLTLVLLSTIAFGLMPTGFSCQERFALPDQNPPPPLESYSVVGFQCAEYEYNPMATLSYSSQASTVRHLFTTEVPQEFPLGVLFLYFVVSFFLTCVTMGSAVPSGLLVPMLIIGGSFGRFVGVIMNDIFSSTDPGVYALVGASAFMGGVTRMTMSLSIILLEITDELEFLLPIMLAIMISKWIGDLLTEPLYESILRLKCIPFLEPDPVWITSLMDCKDIMSKPVVFLHAEETVGHILEVLHNCRHMSFPVVETVEGRDIFRGMILRSHLLVLLEQGAFRNKMIFMPGDFNHLLNANKARKVDDLVLSEDDMHFKFSLLPHMNPAAITVFTGFNAEQAYRLFRALGLRHLPVVNYENEVVGMITRKDLTEFALETRYSEVLERFRSGREILGEDP